MSTVEQLQAFISIRKRFLKNDSYSGICYFIEWGGYTDKQEKALFKTLWKYTPLKVKFKFIFSKPMMRIRYYWKLNEEGDKKRVELLDKIIEELKKQL